MNYTYVPVILKHLCNILHCIHLHSVSLFLKELPFYMRSKGCIVFVSSKKWCMWEDFQYCPNVIKSVKMQLSVTLQPLWVSVCNKDYYKWKPFSIHNLTINKSCINSYINIIILIVLLLLIARCVQSTKNLWHNLQFDLQTTSRRQDYLSYSSLRFLEL